VSIDWATLNPALLGLVGRLACGADFEVEHADRPRKLVSVKYKRTITMKVVSVVSVGQDEERRERVADDATGADAPWAGKARTIVVGDRVVTIAFECDALENTDTGWAWATVEQLRTRLRRESSLAELDAVDASLNAIGAGVEANFKHADRTHSRVIFELVLNVHAEDIEVEPTGLIEHVEWTDEVKDVDGVQLPSPPLVTNEITPPLE
jgi:hypothetical protein